MKSLFYWIGVGVTIFIVCEIISLILIIIIDIVSTYFERCHMMFPYNLEINSAINESIGGGELRKNDSCVFIIKWQHNDWCVEDYWISYFCSTTYCHCRNTTGIKSFVCIF